jgi:hypothetical protein
VAAIKVGIIGGEMGIVAVVVAVSFDLVTGVVSPAGLVPQPNRNNGIDTRRIKEKTILFMIMCSPL